VTVSTDNDIQRCWECNHPIPKLVHLNSVHMLMTRLPKPGDVSICAACGAFGVFDSLLQVVKPTLQEMQAIMNTPELVTMQAKLLTREGM
jgi:hypothetical protein